MIGGKTVTLCMIVKDEAGVIERCLRSAMPFVDGWVICDTGSTDGTQAIVKKVLEDLPGEVHEREWHGFAENRNELLELAGARTDYLLLLDADETVHTTREPRELTELAYVLERRLGGFDYKVPLLVRADADWRYERRVHEYLTTDTPGDWVDMDEMYIEHRGDGHRGHNNVRLLQNLELVEADLKDMPDDARTVFYMGQTHRELGNAPEAIEWYRRRIDMGGWDEELFYAHYQMGVLLGELDWNAGFAEVMAAWDRRPSRAEPLYTASALCRAAGRWRLSFELSKLAMGIPRTTDRIFVHNQVWDWGVKFEYSIAAYWVDEFELAVRLNDELLALDDLPSDVRADAKRNRRLSIEQLGGKPERARHQGSNRRSRSRSRRKAGR